MSDGTEHLSGRDLLPCGCGSPGQASASTCYCGVEDLLRIIRRRYSLAVMNAIHNHPRARYHDVAGVLSGISSSTLAETLRALEAAQLLGRQPGTEGNPFPTYTLTDSGLKLLRRLRQLLEEL
ncbi:MAG: winged helix-turn-helix transcriptional regulator [Gemmatimonadota bacterium]|nr:winged helix-turn-helix transcriptional regulator [Gemmatimonadota bacterium]